MIALIPARGGSKGLPNKNIKLLLGKPMIVYSIEAALKSKYIDEVYVSTDCEKIAEIARENGAKVPFLRPKELASDNAKAIDTYLFMLSKWSEMGKSVQEFIILQPTSPLRTSQNINEAIALFKSKNADSVISYTKESHPIAWHKKIDKDFKFINIFNDNLDNRQAHETTYYPNGSIFIFSANLIKKEAYYSDNSFAYIMPRKNSVDIDFIEDFEYAEFLLKKIKK